MPPRKAAAPKSNKRAASDADDKPKPTKDDAEDSPLSEVESEEDKPKKKKAKKAKEPVTPLDKSLPVNKTVPDPLEPFEKPKEGVVRISAWNVAGLRASEKKGFSRYVNAEDADILVVTETKTPEIAVESLNSRYEHRFWGDHHKKGQAGIAIFSRHKPLNVVYGLPDGTPDVSKEESEGRTITLEFESLYLIGVYVPNAGAQFKTLNAKKAWNRAFERYLRELDAKKPVVWCGDFNAIRGEKDIRNWKTNHNKSAGAHDDEIEGLNSQLMPAEESGHEKLVDVWRHLNPDKEGHYTYQAYKFDCRTKGIGWRLDYQVVSERLMPKVKACEMRHEIWGASDHLPIVLDIEGPL
ncbi:hypothetical protein JCM8097_006070 [Rhodosporidiobolus ruineniae]